MKHCALSSQELSDNMMKVKLPVGVKIRCFLNGKSLLFLAIAMYILGAGRGVFVTDGVVCRGQIVALYPGTLYYPGERVLIQSIRHPFILCCSDGVMVDGRNTGLSRSIYK